MSSGHYPKHYTHRWSVENSVALIVRDMISHRTSTVVNDGECNREVPERAKPFQCWESVCRVDIARMDPYTGMVRTSKIPQWEVTYP